MEEVTKEKAAKALIGIECCMKSDCKTDDNKTTCPYYTDKPSCIYALMKDVFELLKKE